MEATLKTIQMDHNQFPTARTGIAHFIQYREVISGAGAKRASGERADMGTQQKMNRRNEASGFPSARSKSRSNSSSLTDHCNLGSNGPARLRHAMPVRCLAAAMLPDMMDS